MDLETIKVAHCIGIGGIAISGIAKLLHSRGVAVSGSDGTETDITRSCAALGIVVAIGHRAQNVSPAVEVVIYSEAVPDDNPERAEARRRGIVELAGADALALLTQGKRLVAVSGTNGKSTTTAMIGVVLEHAGLDPPVVVGSMVPGWPLGSVRDGKGDWMVIEADEYARKMLKYSPDVAVITNIAEDHMDVYKDLDDMVATFQKFIDNVKPGGVVVLHEWDRESQKLKAPDGVRMVRSRMSDVRGLKLTVPGAFNRENAAMAFAACRAVGVDDGAIRDGLLAFRGIWRRFEVLGEWHEATIVSDYAHHPIALSVTLDAARSLDPRRRIIAVFQPHHHNRTRALFDDFARSFGEADVIVLTDVYDVAGREAGDRVDIADLVAAVSKNYPRKIVLNGGSPNDLRGRLESLIHPGDLLLFLGAGDIDTFAHSLVT